MGRYYWDKKDTVEDCRSVSIAFLSRQYRFHADYTLVTYWNRTVNTNKTDAKMTPGR